jgi:thiol:disulfide interchange protein
MKWDNKSSNSRGKLLHLVLSILNTLITESRLCKYLIFTAAAAVLVYFVISTLIYSFGSPSTNSASVLRSGKDDSLFVNSLYVKEVQSAEQLDQLLKEDVHILCVFYASWCPHCRFTLSLLPC